MSRTRLPLSHGLADTDRAIAALDVFYAGPIRLGESICWHPIRESVWWVDIVGRRLFESKLDGTNLRVLACSQMVGAVAPTSRGGLIAALHDGIYLVDPTDGAESPWCAPAGCAPERFRFNDGKVDPRGRFWAGTIALDGSVGQAQLYRIGGDRSIVSVLRGVTISNGLAWSLDQTTLYYIDSATLTVQAMAYDPASGAAGESRVAIRYLPQDGLPDGCALDAEGKLWVAHWGGGKVTCSDPRTGKLLRTIALPVRNVTSCAFVGEHLDQLLITTAAADAPASAGPCDGFVFQCDPQVVGASQPCFRLPD